MFDIDNRVFCTSILDIGNSICLGVEWKEEQYFFCHPVSVIEDSVHGVMHCLTADTTATSMVCTVEMIGLLAYNEYRFQYD